MRIYHYTSIDTLALILKNKTIRFNRLDKVDDIEEGTIISQGVKLAQYTFVSCWTKSEEENISLWKLYGGNENGIRISMEHKMFNEYTILYPTLFGKQWNGILLSKIPQDDMVNPQFWFLPIQNYNNDLFFRDIKYVSDISEVIQDPIKLNIEKNNQASMNVSFKSIGSYKHKRWEFQQESRFVLYCLPHNPLMHVDNPDIGTIMMNIFLRNLPLPFDYYDLQLKPSSLDNLIITLSPSATISQKIIVEALRDKFAPNAKVEESKLSRLIKIK